MPPVTIGCPRPLWTAKVTSSVFWKRAMNVRRKESGFTLIELLIVITLLGIVATVAVPSFSQLIESNRRVTTTNDLLGLINYARAEALRRGVATEVSPQSDRYAVTIDAGTTVLREMGSLPGNVTVTRIDGGGNLQFRGNGMSNVNFASPAQYRICSSPGSDGVIVQVNGGGQISTDPSTVSCP